MKKKLNKKTSVKKANAKLNNKKRIYILAIIIILIALVSFVFYVSLKNKENAKKEWVKDNCTCLEWNGTISCPAGYTLQKNKCWQGNYFTNKLISCSKYECPNGEIVNLNG